MTNEQPKKQRTTMPPDERFLKRGIKHQPKKRKNKQTDEQKKISCYFSKLGKKSWKVRKDKITGRRA
jgi:hypothetical protein